MNRAFILLGSNIDREVNLPAAVRLLGQQCRLVAISAVYETTPVGLVEQANFFNAAVLLETDLTAAQLKSDVLDPIEQQLHRQRTTDKNAPRTIDMDIILFNNEVLDYIAPDGRSRHIPDPDLLKFVHIAVPLAELAPDLIHPETAEPLATIAQRLYIANPRALWPRPDVQLSAIA